MKMKQHEIMRLKKQASRGESAKHGLIFQTCNPWNPKLEFNQEVQFSTDSKLKHEIKKDPIQNICQGTKK
jgi:hypothetical protein